MTADILAILFKANLAAAVAIVLVLALRKPARRVFGARAAYSLWLATPLAAAASLMPARTIVIPYVTPVEPVVGMVMSPPVMGTAQAAPIDASAVILTLWLAGAAVSFAVLAWNQSRFVKSLGGVVREGRFLRAKAATAGPAVVGAIFPRIVLPADFERRYDPQEQTVVLAHEAAHLASGDAAVNALTALTQCLLWFNPLVHIATRALRIDQELACDAAVLAAFPGERRVYAEALLKTQLATTPLPLGCYWPAGASNPLKERIAMLKSPCPSRSRMLVGASGVTVVSLCFALGAWAAQPPRIIVAVPQIVSTNVGIKPPATSAARMVQRDQPPEVMIGTKPSAQSGGVDIVANDNADLQPYSTAPKPATISITSSVNLAEGTVSVEGDSVSFDTKGDRTLTFHAGSRTGDEVVVRRIVDGQPNGVVILRTGPKGAVTIRPVNP